jgi:ribonucleotide monophosphatase NagD (HAD superfamily)
MIAASEVASGVKATAIGKPVPIMYQQTMEQMGVCPETIAARGDRVDTDILGGKRAGLTTVCVLSDSSDRAETDAFGADMIFEDNAHLLETWRFQKCRN